MLLWQWVWGFPQTVLGSLLSLLCKNGQFRFRGAVVSRIRGRNGFALGPYLFLPAESEEWLLCHEYGHCLQSAVLGPLYLPVVGLPSLLWNRFPALRRKRPYDWFYTERWATAWGRKEISR